MFSAAKESSDSNKTQSAGHKPGPAAPSEGQQTLTGVPYLAVSIFSSARHLATASSKHPTSADLTRNKAPSCPCPEQQTLGTTQPNCSNGGG